MFVLAELVWRIVYNIIGSRAEGGQPLEYYGYWLMADEATRSAYRRLTTLALRSPA